jgi:hypothetical protein
MDAFGGNTPILDTSVEQSFAEAHAEEQVVLHRLRGDLGMGRRR